VSYSDAVILDVRLRPASKLGRNHTPASGFWTYLANFWAYIHPLTEALLGSLYIQSLVVYCYIFQVPVFNVAL